MSEKWWDALASVFKLAAKEVSAIILLASIGVFGGVALFFGVTSALWIALLILGFGGALEIFHIQRQSNLHERSQTGDNGWVMREAFLKQPDWHPTVFEKFEHRGFIFRTIGFNEVPIALSVGGPYCPTCESNLFERIRVNFPGRIKIIQECRCGFSKPSKETQAELLKTASVFGRVAGAQS